MTILLYFFLGLFFAYIIIGLIVCFYKKLIEIARHVYPWIVGGIIVIGFINAIVWCLGIKMTIGMFLLMAAVNFGRK